MKFAVQETKINTTKEKRIRHAIRFNLQNEMLFNVNEKDDLENRSKNQNFEKSLEKSTIY